MVNRATGRALDVSGASTSDGAAAIAWTVNSGANQHWIATTTEGGTHG
ncbi:RICIN domain-containing protein [Streptomyces sp. NPDC023998]